jgi:S1-C subfamily serine protease
MVTTLPAGPTTGANGARGGAFALSDAAAAVAERVIPSVVVIGHHHGNGAGVIWRADGLIITNRHVVRGDDTEVVLADGRRLSGRVVARHPERDLALVKIDADELTAAQAGDSSTVRPGQIVLAIGHPIGFRGAVTAGVVVAAGQAATPEGPRTGDWLQADVTLLPGNSGGPLIDAHGRVVGINTMVSGALSLAIPSQAVEVFVAGNDPAHVRGFLGIIGQLAPMRRGAHRLGFVLTEVTDGAPADRAGLLIGDVIVAIDDRPIVDQESLPAAILRLRPGEAVSVTVLRGGDPRTFTVVPTERA